jgi:outer membrane protein OmpA-like peptidoglycan-associated protein
MRFTLLFLISLSIVSTVLAQQLPSNPDPNKCYVRCVTPDVYEVEYEDVLTYSRAEAMKYAHTFLEIELAPEIQQWETTAYEGCESPNPNDCQILCLRTYPAKYDTIYKPVLDSLGTPFYKEIEQVYIVKKGGLSSYEEIDCELTSYNVLPIAFRSESAEFKDATRALDAIEDRLLTLLEDRPNIRIQINAHTDSRGIAGKNQRLSELRAETVTDYLVSRGINRGRIVSRGYGESQLKNRCADGVNCGEADHRINNRLEFRVLNIDQ